LKYNSITHLSKGLLSAKPAKLLYFLKITRSEDFMEKSYNEKTVHEVLVKGSEDALAIKAIQECVSKEEANHKEKKDFYMKSVPRGDHLVDYWICGCCEIGAKEEHNKEECHKCRDWNGCGRDCTLSRIFCGTCGAEKLF
jgi:hypothetical protein